MIDRPETYGALNRAFVPGRARHGKAAPRIAVLAVSV
jgi:hypothetical protein